MKNQRKRENLRKKYCLITAQGTAAGESGLCDKCYAKEENRRYAMEQGAQADDIPDVHAFHECSGNDAVQCCVCGYDDPICPVCGENLDYSNNRICPGCGWQKTKGGE